MPEKVTRPNKKVTDPVLLRELARLHIDPDYVEFTQDYAPRSRGKEHSPYAKFYRDVATGQRFMVASGLPMVDAYGSRNELEWLEKAGVIENGNNIFHATVSTGTIRLVVLSDQPLGIKKGTECSYHAQLLVNGSEILPDSPVPLILATDPINLNYHDNVILWQYGTLCRRRVRLIPGRYRERWFIDRHPHARVEIRHNKTGALKLKLGYAEDAIGRFLKVRVVGNSEIIESSEFDGKVFPIEIGASMTFFPDAHDEVSSVDGRVAYDGGAITWVNARGDAGTHAWDDDAGGGVSHAGCFLNASGGTADRWTGLYRGIIVIDATGLPPDGDIFDGELALSGGTKTDPASGKYNPDLNIYKSAPASNVALAPGDFNSLLAVAYSTTIGVVAWDQLDYNVFPFNGTGIGAISKIVATPFGTRDATHDAGGVEPGDNTPANNNNDGGMGIWYADKGDGWKPKLAVAYTVPSIGGSMASKMIAAKLI